MMHHAGRASDEYPVEARDLNQSFIGMTMGYNGPDFTVYGSLAAVKLSETAVHVWLEGFIAGDVEHLALDPGERIFFARTTGDWQLRETVQHLLEEVRAMRTAQ